MKENLPSIAESTSTCASLASYKHHLALLAVVGGIFALLYFNRSEQDPHLKELGPVAATSTALTHWANARFEPIPDHSTLKMKLSNVNMQSSDSANAVEQRSALIDSLADFIEGYRSGDFDTYLRFRVPGGGGVWDNNMSQFRLTFLNSVFPESSRLSSSDQIGILRGWFKYTLMRQRYAQDGTPGVDRTKENEGFFRQLAFEESQFRIEDAKVLLVPLLKTASSSENAGIYVIEKCVSFEPSPKELLKTDGMITYATAKIMIQSRDDPPMPLYLRLYWSTKHKVWFPDELAFASSKLRTNIIAF